MVCGTWQENIRYCPLRRPLGFGLGEGSLLGLGLGVPLGLGFGFWLVLGSGLEVIIIMYNVVKSAQLTIWNGRPREMVWLNVTLRL